MWLALFLGPVGNPPCELKDTTHKVGPNEDVRDLSRGDYDTPI